MLYFHLVSPKDTLFIDERVFFNKVGEAIPKCPSDKFFRFSILPTSCVSPRPIYSLNLWKQNSERFVRDRFLPQCSVAGLEIVILEEHGQAPGVLTLILQTRAITNPPI